MTADRCFPSFAEALQKNVLVFDGPMGTELYRHHIFTNRCFDELNLAEPKLIEDILRSYKDAGADVLTTNTFGANRPHLDKYGVSDKVAAINKAGAALARKVADDVPEGTRRLFVAGSIGPVPLGTYSESDWEAIVLEQIDALYEGGVDFIMFETLPSRAAAVLCTKAMVKRPDIPFVLSFAVNAGGNNSNETVSGEPLSRLFAPFDKSGESFSKSGGQTTCRPPIAFGMNCGSGPEGLLHAVEEAVKLTELPLIVQPNAGIPKEFEGRNLYYCSPEYVATYAMRMVGLGAAAIGGCCGMTPEHIQEIAKSIKPLAKGRSAKTVIKEIQPEVAEQPETPLAERSRWGWKLAQKKWLTTVELVPPRGYDLSDTIEKSKKLHRCGIDAVNIPDGPRASSRISPLVVAQAIQREASIEPILHCCCRDKNLIGMQADLLGCASLEIRNLLFITGDPPKLGFYPDATGVFDTDSVGMCAVQRRLNRGVDIGGQSIGKPTNAVCGVGLDPTSLDRKREIERFRMKVDAGAEFAITQPVFDPYALIKILEEVKDLNIPVLAGIWILSSFRNAEFMQNEVPGVIVPDETMNRMQNVSKKPREEQLKVGVEIAREMIAAVRPFVSGIQVSTPMGRVEIALSVLEE
ncbi:MAG: bifunctional homocysteine S-methyltransferase/methylenetetrahydrofolate reductase [Planctomycetaceae bacterium]|jgi:homocysteine S-methyltransferase|nr:bifunctional homocysteine S-methyltransferase/methylenetetrahydrofolate reductase [Planctomycetaceae bacterium]